MADTFLPQEVIRTKRDGGAIDPDEIARFVQGITDNSVTEGQVAALAMAVCFHGMNRDEAVALTLAMRDSGDVLDWAGMDGPVLDKHSTGGVGDNVSLMLAPVVAACGGYVPMISGRGLGHTGGTLDKLESIPGYTMTPDNALFRKVVQDVGCAVIGQTSALAPADQRFYGIRDVTATVESVPLITASILSKKLAAGLDGLVLDVKCGNGAFMSDVEKARELADSLVVVANGAGMKTSAVLTDMNQPLASAAGNAVEVVNAVDFLTGRRGVNRLWDVTGALAGEMLAAGVLTRDTDEGRDKAADAFTSGQAAEVFGRMVAALGGPADFMDKPEVYLAAAPIVRAVPAPVAGTVSAVETRDIGMAVVALGGGRVRSADKVDHAVGLTDLALVGDSLSIGDPLAMVHARTEDQVEEATRRVQAAYTLTAAMDVADHPIIIDTIHAP